jgi:hypothetical protein
MNTNTRGPQVKLLTRCPTVLLRYLTGFNSTFDFGDSQRFHV